MMGYLRLVLAVLLMASFSSVYGGDCFTGELDTTDISDCRAQAEKGNASAQSNLGVMYFKGRGGVLQDYKEAAKWFRLAADNDDTEAKFYLGLAYVLGNGVPQDNVMAHMYWNLAARDGHKEAIEGRGMVTEDMTQSEIEKAQKLAKEWVPTWVLHP
jgi:TPR repeat protein